jgi:hypothetical protein
MSLVVLCAATVLAADPLPEAAKKLHEERLKVAEEVVKIDAEILKAGILGQTTAEVTRFVRSKVANARTAYESEAALRPETEAQSRRTYRQRLLVLEEYVSERIPRGLRPQHDLHNVRARRLWEDAALAATPAERTKALTDRRTEAQEALKLQSYFFRSGTSGPTPTPTSAEFIETLATAAEARDATLALAANDRERRAARTDYVTVCQEVEKFVKSRVGYILGPEDLLWVKHHRLGAELDVAEAGTRDAILRDRLAVLKELRDAYDDALFGRGSIGFTPALRLDCLRAVRDAKLALAPGPKEKKEACLAFVKEATGFQKFVNNQVSGGVLRPYEALLATVMRLDAELVYVREVGDAPPPAGAVPREKMPEPKQSKELDQATIEALEKRGFRAGWVGTYPSFGLVWSASKRDRASQHLDEMIRGFVWTGDDVPDFQALKSVGVPFGLDLRSWHRGEDAKRPGIGELLAGIERLTQLRLPVSGVTSADLESLARLKGLTHIDVSGIWDKGVELKHLAGLKTLTHLTLHGVRDRELRGDPAHPPPSPNGVTDEELNQLAGLKNLTFLDLGSASLTEEGLKHLAEFKNLTHFHFFNGGGVAPDTGVEYLSDLKKLTHLHLGVGMTDAGLKHLSGLTNLTDLSLMVNPMDEGMKHLAGLKNLTVLELQYARVSDAGAKHLAGLKNLTLLYLPGSKVTDEGLKSLSGLTNLTNLTLGIGGVTVAGVKHLADLNKLTRLRVVCKTGVQKDVVEELQKVRPYVVEIER